MPHHVTHRRAFLATTAMSGASWWIAGRCSAAPTARIDDIRQISKNEDLYHGWPTLARRRNGQLLLVYSGGRQQHVCPFGRVELMRSDDDGENWSFPRVVMDGPIDDRDAGVLETAQGSILITTFTSLAYESYLKKEQADWQAAHERVGAAERQAALGVWMIRSVDGGVTFSGRYRSSVSSPHGPIQLSDGRLLYAGKQLWTDDDRVGFAASRDDGQTWEWLSEVPTRDGDDDQNYHELHAVETADGRLIAHLRNHNPQNHRETLQVESDDGGHTWTEPREIGVWGLPSHLLRLRDGRLLMSYGYRKRPYGNQARLSDDHGKTWSGPIVISDDGVGGDLGYPSTVELDDGRLVTIWYERTQSSPRAVLRQARWTLK